MKLAIFAALLAVLCFSTPAFAQRKQEVPVKPEKTTGRIQLPKFTHDPELSLIWENHLARIIEHRLHLGKRVAETEYELVKQRFDRIVDSVRRRTGKPVASSVEYVSHERHPSIECLASFGADGKTPTVSLYLSALSAARQRIMKEVLTDKDPIRTGFVIPGVTDKEALSPEQRADKAFESHVIAVYMREMERVRYVVECGAQGAVAADDEKRIVWDNVCRHTLLPMSQYKGVVFPQFERSMFDAWLAASGDYEPPWSTFINGNVWP